MKIHEKYIYRCLRIAKNGLGSTAPNPMVGCVIVCDNKIIGEGYTNPYGGNHAEVNAINSVKNKSLLKQAILYVTLEPCSHFGKTPPCSNLIIKHRIPNVVVGCIDDNKLVAGRGIDILKKSGCNVTVGVLGSLCKQHHKRFFTFHNKKRPFIILKWAETSDGFIAPLNKKEKKPTWITNVHSRQLVHKWRTQEQAILIGLNTALDDNPKLTTRDWKGKNPIRVVLDKDDKLSKTLWVFDHQAKTIKIKETIAQKICDELFQRNINSIIIEGGAKTLQLFIDSGLWDEARVFTGEALFNEGVRAPRLACKSNTVLQIDNDTLNIYVRN
ncbi:bifunctional diaminohydroxyphosphoribosylaminopyrimidine deaminase/5-amino-6-(5-phosphoribosylamino)uracil reductase RibD [Flavobacteriaceae bacterium]|nr:bifunctional diaminohydroxyphosphoribosylaminopyrimidine deaminase/5-amino-6-(5-phosphoribosylamino)uracil reductase RibD [Flavobacteriaceae bacterium]